MIERVNHAEKIAIIHTSRVTLDLLNSSFKEIITEAEVVSIVNEEVKQYLADGALDIMMKEGNTEKYNALVLALIREAQKENDVVVPAQGSMAILELYITSMGKPVLSNPGL